MSTLRFAGGLLPRRSVAEGQLLSPGDPASLAVTDFTREHPVTVDADRQIDDALNDMIILGVRALLVYKESRVVGLVTSYDIQGERPIQFLQTSTFTQHRDIHVAHIMTPWDELSVLGWGTLEPMRAGDLLHLMDEAGLTHLIVVESDRQSSSCIIRALASRARLRRQLQRTHH